MVSIISMTLTLLPIPSHSAGTVFGNILVVEVHGSLQKLIQSMICIAENQDRALASVPHIFVEEQHLGNLQPYVQF